MIRLRITASVSLVVLVAATGLSLWASAWPRMQDRATEASVAARGNAGESPPPRPVVPARARKRTTHRAHRAAASAAPVPPKPVHAPSPSYPIEALRRQRGGTVLLRVRVDAGGAVTQVAVARSSGDAALDASARKTMRQWRFQPPSDGESMSFDYPITFRIGAMRATGE